MPWRFWMSLQFAAAKATPMRSSSGPCSGTGTVTCCRASRPPVCSTPIARIVAGAFTSDAGPGGRRGARSTAAEATRRRSPLGDRGVVVAPPAIVLAEEVAGEEREHRGVEGARRDLGHVAVRIQLDEVDRRDPRFLAEDEEGLEQVRRMDAVRGGRRRARRVAQLENVDVHRDVDGVSVAAGDLNGPVDRLLDALPTDLPGGHDRAALALDPALVVARVHEPVDPDLDQVPA